MAREADSTKLNSEIARLHSVIADQSAWGRVAIEHQGSLAAELDAIRRSTSWKITGPIRGAATFVREIGNWAHHMPAVAVGRTATFVRVKAPVIYYRIAVSPWLRRIFRAVGGNSIKEQRNSYSRITAVAPLTTNSFSPASTVAEDTDKSIILSLFHDRMRSRAAGARLDGE